ncbi:MAG TPA: hypothetical protein DIC19_01495 [Erysipelotrichaceae bacterium]|nr:hypothetical protein [Erysipelotrichaceae bacterium]
MRNSKSGFTLIELVITMLIVVIVFGILANLVGFSTTFFRDENTQVANQTALRQVAVTFEKDIRRYALNESLVTGDPTCPTLGSMINYCLNVTDKTISRDGVVVARGIESFVVTKNATKVNLYMKTIVDSRNQFVDIVYDVYFRTDK